MRVTKGISLIGALILKKLNAVLPLLREKEDTSYTCTFGGYHAYRDAPCSNLKDKKII